MNYSRKFAYLTRQGELILLQEVVTEVHESLTQRGIQIDIWPLTAAIAAIRNVSELLNDDPNRPEFDDVSALVAKELRRVPMILSKTVIRAILREYLVQLRNLDIGRVQYY